MSDFNAKQHIIFTLGIYMYVLLGNRELDHILNPIWLAIGSIFPDADHRKAPAGRILPLWLFFKHRGFTHTWWGLMLFALPIVAINRYWGLSFAIGYFSHLFFDSITPSGVSWFGKKKRAIRKG